MVKHVVVFFFVFGRFGVLLLRKVMRAKGTWYIGIQAKTMLVLISLLFFLDKKITYTQAYESVKFIIVLK